MNYFIAFLLQLPLTFLLVKGTMELTELPWWWVLLICTVVGVIYDIGEGVKRGDFQ